MNILVLNGPNLNLLGKREPEIYGTATLESILADLTEYANSQNALLLHFQSNAEHELVERIQSILLESSSNGKPVDGIIINPAAFTHTSVAIRDALLAVQFRLLRYIFQTFTSAKRFANIRIFQILPMAWLLV